MDLMQYGISDNNLSFLKKKQDSSELIIQTGTVSTTGELVSYTPATGKTFYFISARIRNTTTAGILAVDAQVENNGTAKFYLRVEDDTTNQQYKPIDEVLGAPDSLVGDGAKKYRINITANASSNTIHGTLIGWIE